jgi:hypothetical protein
VWKREADQESVKEQAMGPELEPGLVLEPGLASGSMSAQASAFEWQMVGESAFP